MLPPSPISRSLSPPSSHTSSTPSLPNPTPSQTSILQSLIHTPLLVTLSTGRSFIGHFLLIDSHGNIILSQAEEFLSPAPAAEAKETGVGPLRKGAWGGREMGMVMCPGGLVRKVEAQISEEREGELRAMARASRGE